MKTLYRTIVIILIFVIVNVAFTGCGSAIQNDVGEIEYLEWQGSVAERNDYNYILTGGEEANIGNNKYIFESDIGEDIKRNYIEKQEELLSYLDHHVKGRTFYLTKSYINRGDSDVGAAFTTVDSIGTWEQILATIFLLEGDNSLYGYAYAKAISVAELLGWESDKDLERAPKFVDSVAKVLDDDPGRLHLFLPCFIEPYSNSKQIICAKLLAVQIYDSLENVTEESFQEAIERYGSEHDIEYIRTDCDFKYGGITTPIIIESPYTIEYVSKAFTNDIAYTRKLGITESSTVGTVEESWLYDMTEFVRVRNLINNCMSSAKASIAPDIDSKCEVEFIQAGTGGYYQSKYNVEENKIVCYLIHELPHEYIHYLYMSKTQKCNDTPDYKWLIEGLAMWYGREVEIDLINIQREIADYNGGALDMDLYLYQNRRYVEDRVREGETVRGLLASVDIDASYTTSCEMVRYYIEKYGEEQMLDFYLSVGCSGEVMRNRLEEYIDEFEVYITAGDMTKSSQQ